MAFSSNTFTAVLSMVGGYISYAGGNNNNDNLLVAGGSIYIAAVAISSLVSTTACFYKGFFEDSDKQPRDLKGRCLFGLGGFALTVTAPISLPIVCCFYACCKRREEQRNNPPPYAVLPPGTYVIHVNS